jgi:hypothetical protein
VPSKAITRLAVVNAMACALATTLLSLTAPPSHASPLPSEREWRHDVAQVMAGSRAYIDRRVGPRHGKLAINFDIDNSTLASHYRPGTAVPKVRRFARHARSKGVALLFNTGRYGSQLRKARAELRRAGYPVDGLCGRRSARESVAHSKQRCRARFTRHGYKLIANVGNRSTDFVGVRNYERAYRLPNYRNRLA